MFRIDGYQVLLEFSRRGVRGTRMGRSRLGVRSSASSPVAAQQRAKETVQQTAQQTA